MYGERRRVCLFGTSADPPTGDGGHLGIVKTLAQQGDDKPHKFDEVRVLPVYRHTFSEKRGRLVSYKDRVTMCRLAFQSIPNVVVSEAERLCFEQRAKGLSEPDKLALRVGTADLLDMLLAEESDTDFTFCLGEDTFMDLSSWKWRRSRDVLSLLKGRFVVICRMSATNDSNQTNHNQSTTATTATVVSQNTLINQVEKVNNESEHGRNARILRIPTLGAVSSSLARACTNVVSLSDLVHPNVLKYIKENAMYGLSIESNIRI